MATDTPTDAGATVQCPICVNPPATMAKGDNNIGDVVMSDGMTCPQCDLSVMRSEATDPEALKDAGQQHQDALLGQEREAQKELDKIQAKTKCFY